MNFYKKIIPLIAFFITACNQPFHAYITDKCIPLDGTTPDLNSHVNLVFVPSNFHGDMNLFKSEVERISTFRQNHNAYKGSDINLNIFYSLKETDSEFCQFNCGGIDRAICCNIKTSKNLADECHVRNRQIIVIHNDEKYGGAAYINENIAFVSRNEAAPEVTAHELGHSLFNLGDEYNYGDSTNRSPNCDSQACSKWKDLIGVFDDVQCESNYCKNGSYFVAAPSLMTLLYVPFGSSNERIACCEYANETGEFPNFCDRFFNAGDGLLSYCRKHFDTRGVSMSAPYEITLEKDLTGNWLVSDENYIPSEQFISHEISDGDGENLPEDILVEFSHPTGMQKHLHFRSLIRMEVFDKDGTIHAHPTELARDQIRVAVDIPMGLSGLELRVNHQMVRRW